MKKLNKRSFLISLISAILVIAVALWALSIPDAEVLGIFLLLPVMGLNIILFPELSYDWDVFVTATFALIIYTFLIYCLKEKQYKLFKRVLLSFLALGAFGILIEMSKGM